MQIKSKYFEPDCLSTGDIINNRFIFVGINEHNHPMIFDLRWRDLKEFNSNAGMDGFIRGTYCGEPTITIRSCRNIKDIIYKE